MDARMLVLLAGGIAVQAVALPAGAEPRPQVSALRLSEADVMGRFTTDVRNSRTLRERALALWQTHFAAQAAELERKFRTEEDWRPVLADAAVLIDDFLEASLLPRHGEFRAEGPEGAAGKVWVETLDPRTGQRVRRLQEPARRRPMLAPEENKHDDKSNEAKPAQPDKGLRRGGAAPK